MIDTSFSYRAFWALCIMIAAGLAVTVGAQTSSESTKTIDQSKIITGRVSLGNGEAVANTAVQINAMTGENNETVRTDASGNFKSGELRPGLYRVFAYVPGYVSEASLQPNQGLFQPGDTINLKFVKGGVITGTVTTSTNTPVVAVAVRAIRIRDQNGKPIPFSITNSERLADDRGVYRLYGLPAGTYLVSAGGSQRNPGVAPGTAYENDAPTYAPASTRDTATEITLNPGDEVTADIQYRGEAGHAISGTIMGADAYRGPVIYSASISLISVRTHEQFMNGSASSYTNYGFAFYGIPDGEYELAASQGAPGRGSIASPPKRIKVQGADVTGITLTLGSLATISGQVVFEPDPKAACARRRADAVAETIVFGRRLSTTKTADAKSSPDPVPLVLENAIALSTLEANGNFTLKNLRSGNYLIEPREPGSGWYLRAINSPNPGTNLPRDGVTVKTGDQLTGILVTISEGGASVRGHITTAEGQTRPANLRTYLVPSEREAADNVLRFYEGRVEAEGTFVIDNVSPGKYWILARPPEENNFGAPKLVRQDGAFREQVARDAQTSRTEISFKPCERVDYHLAFTAPTTQP